MENGEGDPRPWEGVPSKSQTKAQKWWGGQGEGEVRKEDEIKEKKLERKSGSYRLDYESLQNSGREILAVLCGARGSCRKFLSKRVV